MNEINGMLIETKNDDGLYNIYTQKYIGLGMVKNRRLKRDIINL